MAKQKGLVIKLSQNWDGVLVRETGDASGRHRHNARSRDLVVIFARFHLHVFLCHKLMLQDLRTGDESVTVLFIELHGILKLSIQKGNTKRLSIHL